MADKKVFRALISETQGFYVDVEAESKEAAMEKVRHGLAADSPMVPIEDDTLYTGYQIEDAIEVAREDADIQA